MTAVFVLSANGERLMPTMRFGHVRHLLRDGKARIVKYRPFTIQLLGETKSYTQPVEIGMDAGYQHIGLSVKSESKEYVSAEYQLLSDEKSRHDDQRKYRRSRRNRLRYRKARFNNRTHSKPQGWFAPSIQHKADAHIRLINDFSAVVPITSITVEVGQFDPALLKAMYTGEAVPQGADYQQGTLYFADSLRAAVMQRDGYRCTICKKADSSLHLHHMLYWKGRHADTLNELITVCEKCHTSANHQPGGKLYGLEKRLPRLEGAAYMNIVRWYVVNRLKELYGDIVHFTYGAATSRKRKDLGISKSHANDAFCIGQFNPEGRATTMYYSKRRRNSRILEKFYDAKIVDNRTGAVVKGVSLGCERTNRRESRTSEKSLRGYRGVTSSKGRRSIRKCHYSIQPGDKVLFDGHIYTVKGVQNLGKYVAVMERTPINTARINKIIHAGAWMKEKTPA